MLSRFTLLIFNSLLFLLASCSNIPVNVNNLQPSVVNHNSASAALPTNNVATENLDKWLYINQNPQNKLGNYQFSNDFAHAIPITIALGTSYPKYSIAPNFVINNDKLYYINGDNHLLVIDITSGTIEINRYLSDLKSDHVVGIAYNLDYIYITTAEGNVFAIYKNGDESWNLNLMYPIQSAPIINNDTIFIVANNTVYGLDINTGEYLWKHQGVETGITINKAIAPTVYQNFILAGLSNGNTLLLRQENGELRWNFSLNKLNYTLSHAIIAPIVVVNNGPNILASSYNGTTVLLDPTTNSTIWKLNDIGYINPPLVTKQKLFVIDITNNLTSINLTNGKIFWYVNLPKYNSLNFMNWFGPYMVNNHILVYNKVGDLLLFNPRTGLVMHHLKIKLKRLDKLTNNFAVVNNRIIINGNTHLYIIK